MLKNCILKKNFDLDKNDKLLLAIPPSNLSRLFPSQKLPVKIQYYSEYSFKLPEFKKMFTKKIIGFINSLSHWIFIKKTYSL